MTDYAQKEKTVVATAIFKMKMRQTVKMIKEEHLQDTCGAEMIFEGVSMKKMKKYRWRIWSNPLLSLKTRSLKYTTPWRK